MDHVSAHDGGTFCRQCGESMYAHGATCEPAAEPAAAYVAEYAARKYNPHTYVAEIEAETDKLAALLGAGWDRASRAGLRSTYGEAFINMISGEFVYRRDGRF